MRIGIRWQLSLLVLFLVLMAVIVTAITTWAVEHHFFIQSRETQFAVVATLKAAQLSSNMDLMERSCRILATRQSFQSALMEFNDSESTNFSSLVSDLQSAMSGDRAQLLTLQLRLYSRMGIQRRPLLGTYGLLNVTAPTVANTFALPYDDNGTPILLGEEGYGYPPGLYPNLTYTADGDQNLTSYLGDELSAETAILLGPLRLNDTSSLFSVTLPIVNNNTSAADILGWLTVVVDGSLIENVIRSAVGLGETGTTLLIGPATQSNKLLQGMTTNGTAAVDSSIADTPLEFIFPPYEGSYDDKRHSEYSQPGANLTFTGSAYPLALDALLNQNDATTGGTLDTKDESGTTVAAGFAIPQTNLANWVLIVEQSRSEAYDLVHTFRLALLGTVFGMAGLATLVVIPAAHRWSAPIRRLRAATSCFVGPMDGDLTGGGPMMHEKSDSSSNGYDEVENKTSWWKRAFRIRHKPKIPTRDSTRSFPLPQRVKDRRHCIQDELTDLTKTFNSMTEELALHYGRLEERVRIRTAELELSRKTAEAANEHKSIFIANISHELKTPLNGILGMTAVCMQERDMSKIQHSLKIIYKSGDLLHHLLTDLLTFSRNVMAKDISLEEQRFTAVDIASQLSALFFTQARDGKIDFSIEFQGPYDSDGDHVGTMRGDCGKNTGRVKDMILWGDSRRLLQVAINFVSNSLKFTPPGGTVKFRLKCLELVQQASSRRSSLTSIGRDAAPEGHTSNFPGPSRNSVDSSAGSEMSLIAPEPNAPTYTFEMEVEDTGPGIPISQQSRIFEPFVQGDLRLTKKHGGTGLGLSICSQIAKLMHGSIDVESEPGKGAKFKLTVPLKLCGSCRNRSTTSLAVTTESSNLSPASKPPAGTEGAATPLQSSDTPKFVDSDVPIHSAATQSGSSPATGKTNSRLRVLVAEDNAVNAEVVTRMLKLEKIFDVVVAKDGLEAIEKVKQCIEKGGLSSFDLILMDIQMPNMDGRQSTRLIRQAGFTAPIVALTAFSDEINQKECHEAGMDYLLAKPLKRPALKHVLKTYCSPTLEVAEEATKT